MIFFLAGFCLFSSKETFVKQCLKKRKVQRKIGERIWGENSVFFAVEKKMRDVTERERERIEEEPKNLYVTEGEREWGML